MVLTVPNGRPPAGGAGGGRIGRGVGGGSLAKKRARRETAGSLQRFYSNSLLMGGNNIDWSCLIRLSMYALLLLICVSQL